MSTPERRGLGRGLGAIIRDTSEPETHSADPAAASAGRAVHRRLLTRLVDVGLDLLEPYEPSHLGYLHQVVAAEPRLILRRPCLSSMSPTAAYRLLAALDRAAADVDQVSRADIDGASLCFVPSRGPHSTGVHLVGTPAALNPTNQLALERRCRAVAQVVHQLHREIEPEAAAAATSHVDPDGVVAHARLLDGDGRQRHGEGRAGDEASAVARAVVDALDPDLTVRACRSLHVGDHLCAVLTVLVDGQGQPQLGFTVAEAPTIAVAASSALRAIGR